MTPVCQPTINSFFQYTIDCYYYFNNFVTKLSSYLECQILIVRYSAFKICPVNVAVN